MKLVIEVDYGDGLSKALPGTFTTADIAAVPEEEDVIVKDDGVAYRVDHRIYYYSEIAVVVTLAMRRLNVGS
jgi:hypothetical protein